MHNPLVYPMLHRRLEDVLNQLRAACANHAAEHLSQQVQRLISRCATDDAEGISIKQRRRFRKLEREVLSCGEDIQGLQRFVNAQVTAFRKILKKYRVSQEAQVNNGCKLTLLTEMDRLHHFGQPLQG